MRVGGQYRVRYTRLMAERGTQHGLLTIPEYLEMEETASVRHEYVGGMVYAMIGAAKRHNRIIGNISARLLGASRGGPCRVYTEAVKLRVEDRRVERYWRDERGEWRQGEAVGEGSKVPVPCPGPFEITLAEVYEDL